MRKLLLGALELEVLHFVLDHPGVSVREVAEQFGVPRNLARTTLLTVMENLRKKGYLKTEKSGRAARYLPAASKNALLGSLVNDFIENTLGGSVSPVFAFLAENRQLSDEELAELEGLVEELKTERGQETDER